MDTGDVQNRNYIAPCSHEADKQRILCWKSEMKKAFIKTIDTGVMVLAILSWCP